MFTIVAQIRNEEKRLSDWIRYHSKIDVTEFIIFCDNCNDNSENILNSMKEEFNIKIFQTERIGGYVESNNPLEYKYAPLINERVQMSFTKGFNYLKSYINNHEHWTFFIDVDEYVVPQTDLTLSEIVKLVPKDIYRIYIASYDFKCPFDLNLPVYTQTYMRWSDYTRTNGVSNGHKGWYKNRGKSMIRTIDCITDKVQNHVVDESPYYQNDELLKINHYRNFGEMQIYDYEDKKILDWL